jgi:hypothetical protein
MRARSADADAGCSGARMPLRSAIDVSLGRGRGKQVRRARWVGTCAVGPDCLEFVLGLLHQNDRGFAVLAALIGQTDRGDHGLALKGKRLRQVAGPDRPFPLGLDNDELSGRAHLVEPAKEPDEKDDRNRNADQPKQETSTHSVSSCSLVPPANVGSALKFQSA